MVHGVVASNEFMHPDPALHPLAVKAPRALLRGGGALADVIKRVGPCRLPAPQNRQPFESLLRAIAYQQLHGKAAAAILARFIALYPGTEFPAADRILATDPARLREVGLSGSKIAAIRDLCERSLAGGVPNLAAAQALSDEDLIARLVAIRGIGRWSVEMLLIFGLGRPDVLPVDDFGVREGHRKAAGLEAQLKPKALGELGLQWAPYRSFAAWYFWRACELNWMA